MGTARRGRKGKAYPSFSLGFGFLLHIEPLFFAFRSTRDIFKLNFPPVHSH